MNRSRPATGPARPWQKALVALCLGTAALAPAATTLAQTTAGEETQIQTLVDEMRKELRRGEQGKLIDPVFLRDLRRALSRYDHPWDRLILEDNFSNRGAGLLPQWQVVSGEIVKDWRYGMYSVVQPVARQAEQAQQPAKQQSTLGQLFGALLKEATGASQPQQSAPKLDLGTETTPAAAIAQTPITNAFAIRIELTSRPIDGVASPRFEFGPYQGAGAATGYRLAVLPGAKPSLELASFTAQGAGAILQTYSEPLKLDDGEAHVIEWTRTQGGRMIVTVDEADVMEVIDRRFAGNFDGFSVVNQGGDFALRSVRIEGTK